MRSYARLLQTTLILACMTALGVNRYYRRFLDPSLRLTFFDVGQGDAALVEFPYGRTMLIDSGGGFGDFNIGKRELFLELARLGVLTIDAAVLSHPDQDHGYGFLGIFPDLKVGEFWFNGLYRSGTFVKPLMGALLEGIRARGIPGKAFTSETDVSPAPGVRVQVFPLSGGIRPKSNNRALVIILYFAGCSFLFTGDIEKEGEIELGKYLHSPVTLLKVPHHGSKTSSGEFFLRRVAPKYGVVSVGLHNRYRHPSDEVIARYRAHAVPLFRTDFHGYIRFEIQPDGTIHCETSHGDCGYGRCQSR